MNQTYRLAAGLVAALGLGIAVTSANADPGQMAAGVGPHMQGGAQYGAIIPDAFEHGRSRACQSRDAVD